MIVASILAGGSIGVSTLAEARKGGGARRAPADNRDCKVDKDCVVVADDCCPCSQGGKARAIPKKQKDAYEKDRKKRCADTACTEMMSTDPTCSQEPFCGAGICELGEPANAAPKAEEAPKAGEKTDEKKDDRPSGGDKPKADEKPKAGDKAKAGDKTKAGDKAKPDDKPSSGIEF